MQKTALSFFPILLMLSLLVPGTALAEKPSDAHALEGVTAGKVAWDINMGNPRALLVNLRVIDETYEDLKRQGVEPDMIFTFRGPSARLVSTARTDVPLDEEAVYDEIAEQIKALLAKPNVRMEVCSITTRLAGIDNETLLPGVELVGNTFVSQIGYQSKGYATIPIM